MEKDTSRFFSPCSVFCSHRVVQPIPPVPTKPAVFTSVENVRGSHRESIPMQLLPIKKQPGHPRLLPLLSSTLSA